MDKKVDSRAIDKHVKMNSRLNKVMRSDLDFKLSIFAALLVLFSSMFDPRVSVVISLVAMISFAFYKYIERKNHA